MIGRIVLDTNCLLASLSSRGSYHNVWKGFLTGQYILCVSNEILEEYEEIIARKTNSLIASNVIQTLLNCPYVELFVPHFRFRMIESDWDDNKFADCAVVANAKYIVSDDTHFNQILSIDFPRLELKKLHEFAAMLTVQ